MKSGALALALLSIAMSAAAQLLLKVGMGSAVIQRTMQHPVAQLVSALRTWQVPAGLVLYGLGAIVWLLVLARVDVSAAYPFVGLGIAATAFFGVTLLHEPLSVGRVLGTVLVVVGVLLVGAS